MSDEDNMNIEKSDHQKLFTVQEVADRLRCSRALVYLLCDKGKLSHHRLGLGRGTIRVSEADLETFLRGAHIEPQRITTAVGLKHIRRPAAGSR